MNSFPTALFLVETHSLFQFHARNWINQIMNDSLSWTPFVLCYSWFCYQYLLLQSKKGCLPISIVVYALWTVLKILEQFKRQVFLWAMHAICSATSITCTCGNFESNALYPETMEQVLGSLGISCRTSVIHRSCRRLDCSDAVPDPTLILTQVAFSFHSPSLLNTKIALQSAVSNGNYFQVSEISWFSITLSSCIPVGFWDEKLKLFRLSWKESAGQFVMYNNYNRLDSQTK